MFINLFLCQKEFAIKIMTSKDDSSDKHQGQTFDGIVLERAVFFFQHSFVGLVDTFFDFCIGWHRRNIRSFGIHGWHLHHHRLWTVVLITANFALLVRIAIPSIVGITRLWKYISDQSRSPKGECSIAKHSQSPCDDNVVVKLANPIGFESCRGLHK
jgi:hypothetical protein